MKHIRINLVINLFLLSLLLVMFAGCDSNPVTGGKGSGISERSVQSDTITVFQSTDIYSVNNVYPGNEHQVFYPLGNLDFTNCTKYKIDFDYMVINNPGVAANDLQVCQSPEQGNVLIIGTFWSTNFTWIHYSAVFDINPAINNSATRIAVAVTENCLVYAVKNLVLKKY